MRIKIPIVLPWRLQNTIRYAYRSAATLAWLGVVGLSKYFRGEVKTCCHAESDNRDKVTILIPTLCMGSQVGHLETLHRLLNEFLPMQTHKNYQAIVYCDGPNQAIADLVDAIQDPRIKLVTTSQTLALWGHPQTRSGISMAEGAYFVRMNDDNRPFPHFLETLMRGLSGEVGFAYARVIFKGDARNAYDKLLKTSYLIPQDRKGMLRIGNIDCMCFMVRTEIAKRFVSCWTDDYAADWQFIESMIDSGITGNFVDRIIGEKW
jgi:hypothetical protein